MEKFFVGCFVAGFVLAIIMVALLLLAYAFQWGWNIFMSPAFGLIQLEYYQALAAIVLLFIVGSFINGSRK